MKLHYQHKYPAEQGPIVSNALSAAFMIGILMVVAAYGIATIFRILV